MISIVISTYRSNYLENLKNNIAATIGTDYEIIAIDNSNPKKGLCQVYNNGTRQAQYPIVCYAHEDINFKTNDWGKKVLQLFSANNKLGLVGAAGSSYKPCVPSGWSFPLASHHLTTYMNILQSGEQMIQPNHVYNNPKNERCAKVVSIDGVWFCTKKEIALEMPFDEKTFKGFHCYDVDFSLNVFQKYQVAVTFDVLIEHFSGGSFNKEWVTETFKLHRKWKAKLPIDLEGLTKEQQSREEEHAFRYLLHVMKQYNVANSKLYKLLWEYKIASILNLKVFIKLHLTIAKALYGQQKKKHKVIA
jgi:hypothetical protein